MAPTSTLFLACVAAVAMFAVVARADDPHMPPVSGNILIVGNDGRALSCSDTKDSCYFYNLSGTGSGWTRIAPDSLPKSPFLPMYHIFAMPFVGSGTIKYSITTDGIYYSNDAGATFKILAPWVLPSTTTAVAPAATSTQNAPASSSQGQGPPPAPSSSSEAPMNPPVSSSDAGVASSSYAPAVTSTRAPAATSTNTACVPGDAITGGVLYTGMYYYKYGTTEEPIIEKINDITFNSFAIHVCGTAIGDAYTGPTPGSGSTVVFDGKWNKFTNSWTGKTTTTTTSGTSFNGQFEIISALPDKIEGSMESFGVTSLFIVEKPKTAVIG
eukprot:Opistho-2@77338